MFNSFVYQGAIIQSLTMQFLVFWNSTDGKFYWKKDFFHSVKIL